MAKQAEERRERSAAGHSVKVGDVFRYSWVHIYTNVKYFQVIASTKATVTIREIGQHKVKQVGRAAATVKANPGSFLVEAKPLLKRVQTFPTGEHYISIDDGIAFPDYGRESYSSWYA